MDSTELQRLDTFTRELREWDWLADLAREERTIPWLARKTGKSQRSVYAYKYREATPTLEWLRDAYFVLNGRS